MAPANLCKISCCKPSSTQFRPTLEPLEDRLVPATFGVNPGDAFMHLPLKQRIEAEFPELADPATSDFEKTNMLRQWAYQNIDVAGERDLKLDYDPRIDYYNQSAAEILKHFDRDRGGVWCGGSAYFLQEVYRTFGYEATRFDGADTTESYTHAITLVKINHHGNQRIIMQDAYLNTTFVDGAGAPLSLSRALRMMRGGDDSNVITQMGDIIGRDYLRADPPQWMKDAPTFTQVGPYLWKYKIPMSWETFAEGWDANSFTAGPGYADNMLSIFSNPINSWGQGMSGDDIINQTAVQLVQPAWNGPAVGGKGPDVLVLFGNGAFQRTIQPYGANFQGVINVARGDVNGDGILDVITAPASGGGPHVRVFDGFSGEPLHSFMAYDPNFTGGVNIASGDINGDGYDDIVTAPGFGGGPHVRVIDGVNHKLLWEFYAYDTSFGGGVNVAAGDVNGDGKDDVITAPAKGAPHVRLFDAESHDVLWEFYAYHSDFNGGVHLAAGDTDGDGADELVTSPGAGGSHVRVFDIEEKRLLHEFFAHDSSINGATRVQMHDVTNDTIDDYFVQTADLPVRAIDGGETTLLWDALS